MTNPADCRHRDANGVSAWKREGDADEDGWVAWRCMECGLRALQLTAG